MSRPNPDFAPWPTPDGAAGMPRRIEPAPLPARALALFVDYLVQSAGLLALAKIVSDVDLSFLLTLTFGVLYLGIGNSVVTGGRTLGKRVFGLRTISLNGPDRFLSLSQSMLRYFLSFGLLIAAAELPPLYFRAVGTIGAPAYVELYMLPVLCYLLSNVFSVIFDGHHRALHDHFVKSAVVRVSSEDALLPGAVELKRSELAETAPQLSRRWVSVLAGVAAGSLFWWFSVSHTAAVRTVQAHRYRIERNTGLRILSLQQQGKAITMHALVLPEHAPDLEAERLAEELRLIPALGNAATSIEIHLLNPSSDQRFEPMKALYYTETGALSFEAASSTPPPSNAPSNAQGAASAERSERVLQAGE